MLVLRNSNVSLTYDTFMKSILFIIGSLLLTGCASDYQDLIPLTPDKPFPEKIARQEIVSSQNQQKKLIELHDKVAEDSDDLSF